MNEQEHGECTADVAVPPDAPTETPPEEKASEQQEEPTGAAEGVGTACPIPEQKAVVEPDNSASPEPEAPAEPKTSPLIMLDGKVDALASKTDALAERLDVVRDEAVALQKAVTGFYTQTTDAMHKELEKFRKGLVRKLEQELFGELIDLYDAADRALARVAEDPTRAASLLEGIRDQIDAALFNRGVEKREATIGEKFDGRRHHVARPDVPTGDASLDGLIASTAKPGFDDMDESFKDLRGGCMKLRPIHVRLYKFDPALASPVEPVAPEQSEPQPTEPAPAPTTEAEPESGVASAETPSSEPEARS